MTTDLDQVRQIFLAPDVDPEDQAKNVEIIRAWESDLRHHKAFAEWQELDITKSILAKAKQQFKDISLHLSNNRTMTDQERATLWGKQDACMLIISLMEQDARAAIAQIENEIRQSLL